MKKINQILGGVVAALLLFSVLVYWQSATAGERFERGQKFLPNLNPSDIATIRVTKGEETVTLKREGENYIVQEAHRYPAKNEAVNRFLRDVLDLGLEKEVGRGAELEAELELEPLGESSVEVVFSGTAGEEMVRFRVGKSRADGPGNYVQRLDGENRPIYLTSKSAFLSTGRDSFLKKEIVDVTQSEVQRITGPDFVFETNEDGNLKLASLPAGKQEKSAETSRVKSVLNRLSFEKVYLADDPEVRDLRFGQPLRVELKDSSGYVLYTATKAERSFLRVAGFHTVTQVEISEESSEEELKEKADVLTRAQEMEQFSTFHASWIYEIDDTTAKKLALTRSDLIEDAST